MYRGNSNDYSELDDVRINEGVGPCRDAFKKALREDAGRAAALLNDRRLTFPCLYILREQAGQTALQRHLDPRNTAALKITSQIESKGASGIPELSSRGEAAHSALKWMAETGAAEDLPEDTYAQVLDAAFSVLIVLYRERSILPLAVDLIFRRNRSGRYIHDLVWALFKAGEPDTLKLLAERMRSSHEKDADLAAELLNVGEADIPASAGGEGRYAGYLNWLLSNEPYLYFTDESFQYASRPVFAAVNLERKYLQQSAPPPGVQAVFSEAGETRENLAAFKQLSSGEQKALADYSEKIRGKSLLAWREWMNAPVSEQLRAANAGKEENK